VIYKKDVENMEELYKFGRKSYRDMWKEKNYEREIEKKYNELYNNSETGDPEIEGWVAREKDP
jgi:hypothetical protein